MTSPVPTGSAGIPVIDVAPLVEGAQARGDVARRLGDACREFGFFYVVGHGVDERLIERLCRLSRQFFALSTAEKMRIEMAHGGRAWRGYFPLGGELTSGKPDQKEGLYFGAELADDHPAVVAGTPLHGRNLFPDIPGFRETVLDYMAALTRLGHHLMAGLAMSLGLRESYFADRYSASPLILFRIFNYPAVPDSAASDAPTWGVGEHTDYGMLTILRQDESRRLQIKSRARWIEAVPVPGSFICNIGDMLDRLTRGVYRSTPHRVLGSGNRDRLSLAFFFDPNFNAEIRPIEELSSHPIEDDSQQRWDRANIHELSGTYGDYLLGKVSEVFPQLRREVL
jgi:isopenicillin N synthase-like dioxygenase